MNVWLLAILTVLVLPLKAQKFFKKSATPLSFKEMQLQFNDWKSKSDLKKEKNWKYFKRWEMDMQMHTDAHGNPVDPALYVNEVVNAAKQKDAMTSARSSQVVSWIPSGPFDLPVNQTGYMENGMGRINCMAFDPTNSSTYFVGVAQGGLWKTTNNGQTWTPLTDNLPITRISDIVIDPNNVNTIYISLCDFEYLGVALNLNGRKRNTHYGLGVYKTTDGGTTWQPTGLSFQLTNGDASLIRKLFVSQSNSNKLVACGANGMYTSIDAGATWTKQLDSLFWDMVQDPVNPNTLYAASGWVLNANDGNAAIYKSTDFGVTWTMLNTGIPSTGSVQRIKLAIAPSDNNYVYAIAVDVNVGFYGMYKTTNAGTSWTYLPPVLNVLEGNEGNNTGGQGNYDLALYVDNTNKDKVFTGGVNIWGSVDGAQTFNPVSHWTLNYGPTLHGDIHNIYRQPLTGTIFVCSDGGLYRTSNMLISSWTDANNGIPWPTQWTKLNDAMQITSFYRLSSSQNSSGRVIAGAQDNATFFYDGSSGWATIMGGDGMDNFIDPSNDDFVIGSSQYGNFYLSFDAGLSSNFINSNVNNEVAEWTTPIVADYNINGTFYIGYANVVKSDDGGNFWTSISNFPPGGIANNEISALAVANTNSDVIYAAKRVRYEYTIPGSLYKTIDGGANWTDITGGLPDSLYYTSVDINNANANAAYISMAGFSAGNKVFATTNGGTTWQNISYNLPNLPVNCVKSLPGGTKLLAATDVGLYLLSLNTGSTTWVNISAGLPNVIISDIEVNTVLNKVYVSTFGRGIWEADLSNVITVGVPEVQNVKSDIDLFPSVNKGTFTIKIISKEKADIPHLEIVDILGRKVYSGQLNDVTNKLSLEIKSGKYFAKVTFKNKSVVKIFVVE